MKAHASKDGPTRRPAHERCHACLSDVILFGEPEPGQAVTIQGLIDRTGAGMTPVREALRRWTAQCALQALGNRRIDVREPTQDAVRDLRGARRRRGAGDRGRGGALGDAA